MTETLEYTLYIDESGDEGLSNIWTPSTPRGACPQFFLGAFLIRSDREKFAREEITKIEGVLGNKIRSCNLTHEKKTFVCSEIAKLPIMCFGLISDKSGLARKDYGKTISPDSFYNKNVEYLLEKVGRCAANYKIKVDKVILEQKASKNYIKLRRFLMTVQSNPIHPEAKFLEHLEIGTLDSKTKSEETLLKLADCISHSLYKATIPNQYGLTEQRYLLELQNKFFSDTDGKIFNFGIKAVPDFRALKINPKEIDFLMNMKAA